ncbi:MAG: hypothetical protein V1793_11885 [Pseudomonadota bacterium]
MDAGSVEKKELDKVPTPTLFIIVASTVIIAAFALLVLYPQYKSLQNMEEKSESAAWSLEQQKQLLPAYIKARQAADKEFVPGLKFPERKKLQRSKITELSSIMEKVAIGSNLVYASNSLDINSVNMDSGSLAMDINMDGNLFDLREFLVSVMALSFVDSIGKVTITSNEKRQRFSIRIWIAIEKN